MKNFQRFFIGVVCACLAGCAASRDHVFVRRGDTVYSIAQKNQVAMRDLIEINQLQAPYTLRVRQRLKLPAPQIHVVQKNDTLYSIARRHGMPVSALARHNRIKPPYTIHVGQRLKMTPSRASAVSSPPAPGKSAASGAAVQRAAFKRPASGKVVARYGVHNEGVNIAGKKGSPIWAADDGTVAYVGNDLKGYGNLVLIRHKDGWITAYGHTEKMLVQKGAVVKRGQQIATMGDTGGVKTPQLHFEARYKTKSVNPEKYGVK